MAIALTHGLMSSYQLSETLDEMSSSIINRIGVDQYTRLEQQEHHRVAAPAAAVLGEGAPLIQPQVEMFPGYFPAPPQITTARNTVVITEAEFDRADEDSFRRNAVVSHSVSAIVAHEGDFITVNQQRTFSALRCGPHWAPGIAVRIAALAITGLLAYGCYQILGV